MREKNVLRWGCYTGTLGQAGMACCFARAEAKLKDHVGKGTILELVLPPFVSHSSVPSLMAALGFQGY